VSSKWYVSAPHRDLVPYIRISDISDGKIVRKRLKFVAKEASGQSAISSDILFSVRGTIGKTCIITEAFEGSIVSSNIAILRPRKELIYPRFLARVLSSEAVAKQVAQVRRDQFIPYVSLKDLRNIRIPYCPPKKQADILDRIERLEKDFPKNEMKQKDVEEEIRKTLAAVGQ
jgi:type I restriction enzyme S subunit